MRIFDSCSGNRTLDCSHKLLSLLNVEKARGVSYGVTVGMLGVFAEFETNLRRERQREGIVQAKARGVYRGRKATIDVAAVRRLAAVGLPKARIARQLGIGRASVYRLLTAEAVTPAAPAKAPLP